MAVLEKTSSFPDNVPLKVHMEAGLQTLPDTKTRLYPRLPLVMVHEPEAGPPAGHTPLTLGVEETYFQVPLMLISLG